MTPQLAVRGKIRILQVLGKYNVRSPSVFTGRRAAEQKQEQWHTNDGRDCANR
jgi:hypothetical protein